MVGAATFWLLDTILPETGVYDGELNATANLPKQKR